VWGSFGDRSAVAVYIGRLRQKLEPDPARPRYIVTVWGAGYRLDSGSR
jgi:DNA-binding response OmpR family regulator